MNVPNDTVVISGSSGQTAAYLVQYLLEHSSYQIIATKRRDSADKSGLFFQLKGNPRISEEFMDLTDVNSVNHVISKYEPLYFFNFAAITSVSNSWDFPYNHMEVNFLGVLHLLEAIRKYSSKTRFYNAGSSTEFTDGVLNPESPYGVSKLAARYLIRTYQKSYGLYAVQSWCHNHTSRYQHPNYLLPKITRELKKIKHSLTYCYDFSPCLLGNLEPRRDFSHAYDIAVASWKMLNQGVLWNTEVKEYVLASGEAHSIREIIDLVLQKLDIHGYWSGEGLDLKFFEEETGKPIIAISSIFFRPQDQLLSVGDPKLTKEELNWEPKYTIHTIIDELISEN